MSESVGDTTRREAAEEREHAHLPTPVLGPEDRRAGSRTIDLTKIDFDYFDMRFGKVRVLHRPGSPWVEIEVPDGAIAVWATTGAVHPVTASGAVTDDPVRLPWPDD